ncbi:hypothetical protein B0H19DRAFT_1066723 [Mycena capillaripes]|nr:hypothetical protein B0H19DRAFT_1066723 [Mycena capillaripes]
MRRREANWLSFTPSSGHTITIDFETTGIYDLASDVYIVGDTVHQDTFCTAIKYIHTSPGSGPLEWCRIDAGKPISDFGAALQEHDLIAFVTYCLGIAYSEAIPSGPTLASVAVRLSQFSTGAPHPLATCSTLQIHDVGLDYGRPGVSIEIVDENLALSLVYWRYESRDMDTLHVFNWKSGIPKMVFIFGDCSSFSLSFHDIHIHALWPIFNTGLVFLSTETLIVSNAVEATLDVFHIQTSEEATVPRLTHSLVLPELRDDNAILSFQCRGAPNPRAFTSRPGRTAFPARPENALLLFTFEAGSSRFGSTEHIFVVDRTLLSDALRSWPEDGGDIEWEAWGPRCTRWIDASAMHYITVTSRQRLVSTLEHDPTPIRMLDFNPRRVEAQRDWAEPPNWPEYLDAFEKPVVSQLPYVEIDSKEKFDFGAVLINDENILGVRIGAVASSASFWLIVVEKYLSASLSNQSRLQTFEEWKDQTSSRSRPFSGSCDDAT